MGGGDNWGNGGEGLGKVGGGELVRGNGEQNGGRTAEVREERVSEPTFYCFFRAKNIRVPGTMPTLAYSYIF